MKLTKIEIFHKLLLWITIFGFSFVWGAAAATAKESSESTTATAKVSLMSLALSGPGTAASNSSTPYTASAKFSDGTTRNVTTSATWSESSQYATISPKGILTTTAPAVNQKVVISASYTSGAITKKATKSVTIAAAKVSLKSLAMSGPSSVASGGSANYTATATFSNGTKRNVTTSATWTENSPYATVSSKGVLTASAVTRNRAVALRISYTSGGITKTAGKSVTITALASAAKSINSTSQNRSSLPSTPVPEQALVTQSGFQIFAANDLGMHCGDLDHRVVSILPPFNILHSQVIQKGTSSSPPEILASSAVNVLYSASSNPNDPALANPPSAPIFKTNFWSPDPANSASTIAYDAYNPFYPPSILSLFKLKADMGLPAPDPAQLYPPSGTGVLVAYQQQMPGISAPYSANSPQAFKRFDTDFPFFVNFPFGYRLSNMNWFAADGIPLTPYDDFGRNNAFPLMRVQAVTKDATLTGTANALIASVDTVTPVSAEAACYGCHTSAADGGGGYAACIPGVDANCKTEGSPRSGTAFIVATTLDDTSNVPILAKKEWAADTNILRLHDAKNGTTLQSSTPVVCQTCHYTPALDLAQVGPLGPGDANANGRDQRVHRTNSRVMHSFHGQFTDLIPNNMPPPNDSRRIDPTTGKPVINAFVQNELNATCYQCHPGKITKCLRGVMATTGGLVCQDCHGTMAQVGNDFSANLSPATPFPGGADLTKRVPWANEPACQSCHTGDATSNLGLTDPNVIRSSDGIRLLQAYRINDPNAAPIVAANTRFAEETASNGNRVLYRFSKGHGGVFCEACHGSTHAEWPVQPESGTSIANDNMTATRLQGHTGKLIECTACHTAGTLPVSLDGPHGMHPVNDSRFVNGHDDLVEQNQAQCLACHGQSGQGTVLSKLAATRTLAGQTLPKGYLVSCGTCHSNPITGGGGGD